MQNCSRSYFGNLLKHGYLDVVVFFFAVLNYSQNIEKLLRPSSIPSKLLHLLPSLTASPLAKSRPTHRWREKGHLHFSPLTESKVLRIYVPNLHGLWKKYCCTRQLFFFKVTANILVWRHPPMFKRVVYAARRRILWKQLLTTDKNLIFGSTALHDWLHRRPLTVPRLCIWFVASIEILSKNCEEALRHSPRWRAAVTEEQLPWTLYFTVMCVQKWRK